MTEVHNHYVEESVTRVHSQLINQAVNVLMTASGLTEMAAKTCVYYAVGTYGLEELNIYPLLVFYGATGTGKSAAMKALEKLVRKPKWTGTNLTKAGLRDKLDEAKDATTFMEEGDIADEEYIANRYSRETSDSSVKRSGNFGWVTIGVSYFGATVLHKRKPFNDPATDSRSILIKTRPHPGEKYYLPEIDESLREGLKQLWQIASGIYKMMETSGRTADVWKPLMAVANACDDADWLGYANNEVAKSADKLRLGQEFEPEAIVVNALIALSNGNQLASLMEVKDEIRNETNWQPTSWALASMLRELGFELKKSHGQRKVVLDKIKIANLGEELGIEGAFEEAVGISIRNLE